MKKSIISILVAISLPIISFSSCGSTESTDISKSEESVIDSVSAKVSEDIDSIGEVDLNDKELIEKIEKTYSTLTDSQKEQVKNYATLLTARDELDELIKKEDEEKKKKAEAEQKAEEDKKKCTNEEKMCAKSIIALKNCLKNPDSLQPIHYFITLDSQGFMFTIEYSAQNGFGGSNRSFAIITNQSETANGISTNDYETGLFVVTKEMFDEYNVEFPATSEIVSIGESNSKVDKEKVNNLISKYEKTHDKSLLSY